MYKLPFLALENEMELFQKLKVVNVPNVEMDGYPWLWKIKLISCIKRLI